MMRVANQRQRIFPSHLTNASAQPGKTWKHKNGIFSLKYCTLQYSSSYL